MSTRDGRNYIIDGTLFNLNAPFEIEIVPNDLDIFPADHASVPNNCWNHIELKWS